MTLLAIAICTWNNADSLQRVLDRLTQQTPSHADIEVLVVDNNSTDHTAIVIDQYRDLIPGFRSVFEPVPGLTPARVRAVGELADARWIAFVDDDCLLAPDWSESAVRACRAAGDGIAAIGGLVELDFEVEPPRWIYRIAGAYAEQRPRSDAGAVGSLVGAGMIVRRQNLVSTGWLDGPLLEDRIGSSLISGGDVEIGARLAATGDLWFDPSLRLAHSIPPRRTTEAYALRLQRGLGTGALLVDEVTTSHGFLRWAVSSARKGLIPTFAALRWSVSARIRRAPTFPPRLVLAFWGGWMSAWITRIRAFRTFRGGSIR